MRRLLWIVTFLMPALCLGQTAEDSWDNLKQLRAGQKIQVVDMSLKSLKGTFLSYSEEAVSLRADTGELSVRRADVFRVSSREASKRRRNTLIGLGIGAACGLGTVAILEAKMDNPDELRLIGPLGAGVGAALGAAMPTGSRTIYRAKGRRSEMAQ